MPSQGILNIGAFLRANNIETSITDLAGIPEEYWHIPHADIYGISCVTPQYPYVKKIVQKLKKRQSDSIVVLGGVHPTVLSELTLRDSGCDIVVKNDGELVMLEIVNGRRDKIIQGTLIQDLDAFPFPAWDMLDIYDYHKMGTNSFYGPTKNNREGYVQTARGCPYNCAFCAQSHMTQRLVRFKSINRVIAEVKYLMERFKCDRFYFFDDSFVIKKSRVEDICTELEKIEGLDWHCLSRVDKADIDLYIKMKKAGCKGVCYGIESGSAQILKKVNKVTTPEQNQRAIHIAKEAGLKVRCQVIVGLPGETWDTIEETAQLIRNTNADTWGVHIFVPLPGCNIWENPDKFNFKVETTNNNFEYFQTIGRAGDHAAAKIHSNPEEVIEWKYYLLKIVGEKDIAKFAEIKLDKIGSETL